MYSRLFKKTCSKWKDPPDGLRIGIRHRDGVTDPACRPTGRSRRRPSASVGVELYSPVVRGSLSH